MPHNWSWPEPRQPVHQRFAVLLRMRRVLGAGVLASTLGLLVLSCAGDGPTTPPRTTVVVPPPQFTAMDPFNDDDPNSGECMLDDASTWPQFMDGWMASSDPTATNNCTTNDVSLANAVLTGVETFPGSGVFEAFDPSDPPQCAEGGFITIQVSADLLQTSASARHDFGVWIRTNASTGADDDWGARSGQCRHYNLPVDPLVAPVINNEDVPDSCGGLDQAASAAIDLGTITVPCEPDANSNLIINSCIGWKVPGDEGTFPKGQCPAYVTTGMGMSQTHTLIDGADGFRAGTLPGNTSKCNCEGFSVPVTVLKFATIEVKKVCDPTTDNGTFDLEIDNAGDDDHFLENDAACGGTTGAQTVGAGTSANPGATHSVSESDFTAANYTSTLACTKNGQAFIPSEAYSAGTDRNVQVDPEDVVVCTFTNVRKGTVIIKKETDPDGTTDPFTFTQDVDGSGNFNLIDGGTKQFDNVLPGQYTVTEQDPTPAYDLVAPLSCVDSDAGGTASTGVVGTRTVTINVDPGETVTCTFNNRQRAKLTIIKQTDPDGASGSFGFTQFVDGSGNFSLEDGDSKIFENVVPNSYIIHELDPLPGFDLVSISCTNQGTAGVVLASRNVTVTLSAGEEETCTFTNRQRAMVTVNKREGGGLPLTRAWEFEIRKNASVASSGTVVATGTAVLATGVVNFACSPNPNADCQNDGGGIAKIVPGNYQFCEVNMPAGWANNIAGFTPDGEVPEGSDNGNECIDITLAAGATGVPTGVPDPIDNTPPPGGDARTIGYWKNHSCEAPGNQEDVLSGELPVSVGIGFADGSDYIVANCADAVSLLDKRNINNGKKSANDAAYNLAAQLVAALLNVNAGAGTCPAATQAISDAQVLLDRINFNGTGTNYLRPKDGADYTTANNLAAILDAYNNNTLCP